MLERTDTQGNNVTPPGEYEFTIIGIPEKKKTKKENDIFFIFTFAYILGGEKKKHEEIFMRWTLPSLLEALGFEKVPDHQTTYEWDREECVGKQIKATIIHERDKKDPNKIWARMTNISKVTSDEEIPF